VLIRKVQPSAPVIGSGEYFGSPIAWDGDRMIFGSSGEGVRTGSGPVYIYPASVLSENGSTTLSSLVLSSGALNAGFAAAIKTYTSSVSNATSTIAVTPTVTDPTSTVAVNGVPVTSGTASTSIPLAVGANPIAIAVTAQDGVTTSTYTVTVTRISVDSTLSGLALSAGTLSPAFETGTQSYTASVPNAIADVTVTPTVSDATATVKVNGTPVASGAGTASIPLTVGNNNITVAVTAQDGATTSTYTVTVMRISTTSTLDGLALSSGTLSPTFAAATKTYTACVPNATTSITVTPTLTNSFAEVTVNGTPVTSGSASAPIPLVVGPNPITVLVTAQDGSTTSTYTVTVTLLSGDSSLATLALSVGNLSPTFSAATLAYTSSVSNATTAITVTPTVASSVATVRVNGVSVAAGAASAPIPLAVGSNAISVEVTAQDVGFSTMYTVTVMRPALNVTLVAGGTAPLSLANFTTPANAVNLSLGAAPAAGAELTLLESPGLAFITGRFSNLAQGQVITLIYQNVSYRFVVNYYGGRGNDLVLQWANDKAYSWGSNIRGQLGENTTTNSNVPVAVTSSGVLSGKTILSISAGNSHSLALCADGTVAAWGYNFYGQLGNGSNANSSVPVAETQSGVLVGKTVVAVSTGFSHSLALCSDGTVASWGYNLYGQLGNGNTTNSNVPVLVTASGVLNGRGVVAVAAGYYHNLALCSDGTVVAWGLNYSGQLGNTSNANSSVPVDITDSGALYGMHVINLAAGSDHSLVLCDDGSLVSWGKNANGQLGDGSTTSSLIPVSVDASDVLAGRIVEMISAGGFHNLAACSDGTLVTFGRNTNGQLGNDNNTDSSMPVEVTLAGILNGKMVTSLQAANAHSLALCSDGSIASWGAGSNGMLGNGDTANSSVPVAVTASGIGSGGGFIGLASGSSASHSMALTAIPLSSTSTLASLALSGGTLSPTFDSATISYTASVPNATTSVTIMPTVTATTATVTVNGTTVASGVASGPISLAVGPNTITAVVTAQDGTTQSTYTVTVTRAASTSSGYAGWIASYPVLADAAASGDPDHDGIPNLLEYVLNGDPGTASSAILPVVSKVAGNFVFTFSRRVTSAQDTTQIFQYSSDLSHWTDVTITSPTDAMAALGFADVNGVQAVTVTVPAGANVSMFGRLNVTTPALIVSGYAGWIASCPVLADAAASGDPDHDGIPNLLEYVLNGDPGTASSAILPVVSKAGGNFVFTFSRRAASAQDTTQIFQYSSDLSHWTDVSVTGTKGTEVTIGTADGAGAQAVTVTIPQGVNTTLFGRLKVMQP
jgi:alpha-tubulin suppressor-like RCC1 family protein